MIPMICQLVKNEEEEEQEYEAAPADPTYSLLCSADSFCKICGDEADGVHYGVRSCRGCTAFFRRAITRNLQYQCRKGGNCTVNTANRNSCRGCRLRLCYLAGMDVRAVQPKRDSNGPNIISRAALKEQEIDQTLSIPPTARKADVLNSFSWMPDVVPPFVHSSSPYLLIRMNCDYEEQKKRRYASLTTSVEDILDGKCCEITGVASPEDLSNIFKTQSIMLFEWASKVPEFRRIDPMDKARLLRMHIFQYILLEDIYHTVKMDYTDRLLLVNNTFMAPGIYSNGGNGKFSRELVGKMGGDWLNSVIENCIIPWKKLKVTQMEMLTVRMYGFWNVAHSLLYDESKEIARGALHNLVREYGRYSVEECGRSRDECGRRMKEILAILGHLPAPIRILYEICSETPGFGVMDECDSHMINVIYKM